MLSLASTSRNWPWP